MSSVVIAGDTSGSITLAAPAVAGTTTLTLPATSGTVLTTASAATGTLPTFSAYAGSAQSFTAGVWTKIQINIEEWDTNSNFDTSTYRFTPTVSGYYQVSGRITAGTIVGTLVVSVYKNGSSWKRGNALSNSSGEASSGSSLVYLNGSTDYIELYAYFSSTVNDFVSSDQTYFQAVMVRSA